MKVKEISSVLEKFAPLKLQESYDNAGLNIGNPEMVVKGVLICLDITEKVIDEAIVKKCNLIVSHHPPIFKGLKKITGENYVEKIAIKAIKNDIALYSIHTNLDNVYHGVNLKIANQLGLVDTKILSPLNDMVLKVSVFVPDVILDNGNYAPDQVQQAIFNAGAGEIGNYDSCSFELSGTGTFRGLTGSNPFIGQKGELTRQKEVRIETIFPSYLKEKVVSEMIKSHPYEEVAYDIYKLENQNQLTGAGIVGQLPEPMDEKSFLYFLKEKLELKIIRHTDFLNRLITKVSVCGGSGSFLLKTAIKQNSDIFISSDFKYHDFFDAEEKIMIADIGHYESEKFTIDLLYDFIRNNFSTFAILKSIENTNPIKYF